MQDQLERSSEGWSYCGRIAVSMGAYTVAGILLHSIRIHSETESWRPNPEGRILEDGFLEDGFRETDF